MTVFCLDSCVDAGGAVVLDASRHASGADAGHVAMIRCCWWRYCWWAQYDAMHAGRALSSCRDAGDPHWGIDVCGAGHAGHAGD
jgi:hypothetical protein